MESIIHWLEAHAQPCYFKQHWGIECMGCGVQRSFIALLRGNLIESLTLYPALLPALATFLLLGLHLVFKFKNGAQWVMWLFILTATLAFGNFMFKFIGHIVH